MAEKFTLPGIMYGPGPDGFAILGVSRRFPQGARRAFVDFAKAVSWRPAKMKATDTVALALVPSTDGVLACRMTDCAADAYGRTLAMRVEGVLCGHDDAVWRRFAELDAWPPETISEPWEVSVPGPVDTESVPQLTWRPCVGRPLILFSRELVSAPGRWFIV